MCAETRRSLESSHQRKCKKNKLYPLVSLYLVTCLSITLDVLYCRVCSRIHSYVERMVRHLQVSIHTYLSTHKTDVISCAVTDVLWSHHLSPLPRVT